MLTAKQVDAAIQATAEMGRAIREFGEVPSGLLYAHVMSTMDLPTFNRIIDLLKRGKMVTESNNVLKWIGPI